MNKEEEKCLIDCLMEINNAVRELNVTLIYLSNNLYALKNLALDAKKLSKSDISKILFPHLCSDEIIEFNKRAEFIDSLNDNCGFTIKKKED